MLTAVVGGRGIGVEHGCGVTYAHLHVADFKPSLLITSVVLNCCKQAGYE